MEQAVASESPTFTNGESPAFDIAVLRTNEIAPFWDSIKGLLAEALEYGIRTPPELLYAEALQYRVQIWLVMDETTLKPVGAAATTVQEYGGGQSALRVIALAGTGFKHWQPAIIDKFETFARGVGCQTIEAVGRKGWGRSLDRYGFEPKYTTFVKRLEVQQ